MRVEKNNNQYILCIKIIYNQLTKKYEKNNTYVRIIIKKLKS